MVPMMIFAGIPLYIAVGTSASIITGTALSGSLYNLKRGNINAPLTFALLCGSIIGAKIGLLIFTYFKKLGNLNIIIGLSYITVLSIVALVLYWDVARYYLIHRSTVHKPAIRQTVIVNPLPLATLIGFITGILSAIMGIGGAILLVPIITYVFHISFTEAAATALLQSLFMSIFITFVQSTQHQAVDIILCLTILTTSVIGVQFGSRLALITPVYILKLSMAIIVSIICLRFIDMTFATPSNIFIIE